MISSEQWNEAVRRVSEASDPTGGPLKIFSMRASDGESTWTHDFVPPAPFDLRSISKTVVALVAGTMIDRGDFVGSTPLPLRWDTPIDDLIAQVPLLRDIPRSRTWHGVEFGHLLSHTIGHDRGFLFRADLGERSVHDLLPLVFAGDIGHPAGTHFAYSNVGFYLASVLLQELTGRRLSDHAREILFDPLDMPITWRQYGRHDAGCTGLRLTPDDLHRLAELLRDNGIANERQIVPAAVLERMRIPAIAIPPIDGVTDPLPKAGYGYGLWLCGDGRFFGYGTSGQFAIVVPDQGRVITTLGDTDDMSPLAGCLAPLWD